MAKSKQAPQKSLSFEVIESKLRKIAVEARNRRNEGDNLFGWVEKARVEVDGLRLEAAAFQDLEKLKTLLPLFECLDRTIVKVQAEVFKTKFA